MEFLTAFFELARSKGVHTALDTAGQPFRPDDAAYLADFDRLMKSTSLVILDLKEIDPEKHRRLTGKDNANILAMRATSPTSAYRSGYAMSSSPA